MDLAAKMVAINQGVYERASTAKWYAAQQGLTAVEHAALALCRDTWSDGRVLDIGIGGGRTTAALAARSATYVGVDYSQAMIAAARARLPGLDLRQADARDLSDFADASFDFAMFSFNGIDAVDHEGRALVLREVRRVLRPGGAFVMSSHNLDCRYIRRHWRSIFSLNLEGSPWQAVWSMRRIPIRLTNVIRNLRTRVRTPRYAIMADPGNDFAAPHYYAGAPEVAAQLSAAGFDLRHVLDDDGAEVASGPHTTAHALTYLARRP